MICSNIKVILSTQDVICYFCYHLELLTLLIIRTLHLFQHDYYNQRLYGGRFANGLPPPVASPPVAAPVAPTPPPPAPTVGRPVLPPYGGPAGYASGAGSYGLPVGPGGYGPPAGPGGYGPIVSGGYAPPIGPAASYPFVNPNVQYASSEDVSGTTTASSTTQTQSSQASESLASFKVLIKRIQSVIQYV